MPDQPIRPAATLVLARPAERGVEVFLSRRTSKAAFMANAWVYPGGRVDAEDADPAWAERLLPAEAAWFVDQFEDEVAGPDASAHFVAALRESFEEAGVLFARHREGAPVALSDPHVAARFSEHRSALNRRETSFMDILAAEDLVLDAVGLDYFAHWITPPFESRRFDTRFFFAVLPDGQTPVPDYSELVHGDWFAPRDAVDAYLRGELQLAPPTLCTLDDLATAGDMPDVRRWVAAEEPVAIEPRLSEVDGLTTLLLPGDPLYPSERPVRGPTRVVFRDGRFSRE